MGTIVVGYLPGPEGRVVLERAVAEASLRSADLLVLAAVATGQDGAGDELDEVLVGSGVPYEVVSLAEDDDAADTIVATAERVGAAAIVIGVRRRSPVGKLILGSSAQRIILDASCPVMAVKAPI